MLFSWRFRWCFSWTWQRRTGSPTGWLPFASTSRGPATSEANRGTELSTHRLWSNSPYVMIVGLQLRLETYCKLCHVQLGVHIADGRERLLSPEGQRHDVPRRHTQAAILRFILSYVSCFLYTTNGPSNCCYHYHRRTKSTFSPRHVKCTAQMENDNKHRYGLEHIQFS